MDYVEQRMAQEAQREAAESLIFLTPLNVLVSAIVLYTLYSVLRPLPKTEIPRETPPVVFKTYTPHTLLPYDGRDGRPVFLAVRGRVYDVSSGRNFYGPGGPYENFAGRDASRGLASHSFDESMLTKDLDGPLDALADLDDEQREALQGWEERFDSKYLVVGRLVSVADYAKLKS